MPEPLPLILASGSAIRARLLAQARLPFVVRPVRIDEEMVRAALQAEGAGPRDMADALAELKALRVRDPGGAMVLGADQILDCQGAVFAKPESVEHAIAQLQRLSGRAHRLHSALVVCCDGAPIWRHVGEVRLTMHPLTEPFIRDYVARNWDSIRDAVGCYKLEEEGVRLFARIEGDYFTILGLPLIELLTWLRARGDITT
jgi:septum formation protein